MSSLNRVELIGNLGADPEIRTLNSGDKVANFRLATSESWQDKRTGERVERTEWHVVVCFNDHLVEVIDRYVKKGTKVFISGSLQTRKWQDQNGADRYTTEVVMQKFRGELVLLSAKQQGDAANDDRSANTLSNTQPNDPPRAIDDDIPF